MEKLTGKLADTWPGTEVSLPAAIKTEGVEIDGKAHLLVESADIEKIVAELEKAKEERDLMEWGIYQICGVLGLTNEDRSRIKPEVISGEEGVFKNLMKSGGELFTLFMQTNLPGRMGKNAEAKVKEKFAFIEKLMPLLKEKDNGKR